MDERGDETASSVGDHEAEPRSGPPARRAVPAWVLPALLGLVAGAVGGGGIASVASDDGGIPPACFTALETYGELTENALTQGRAFHTAFKAVVEADTETDPEYAAETMGFRAQVIDDGASKAASESAACTGRPEVTPSPVGPLWVEQPVGTSAHPIEVPGDSTEDTSLAFGEALTVTSEDADNPEETEVIVFRPRIAACQAARCAKVRAGRRVVALEVEIENVGPTKADWGPGYFAVEFADGTRAKRASWHYQPRDSMRDVTIKPGSTYRGVLAFEGRDEPFQVLVLTRRGGKAFASWDCAAARECVGPAEKPPARPRVAPWLRDQIWIKYVVDGAYSAGTVTYQNKNEDTSQASNVSLPWVYRFRASYEPDFMYVSAQNNGSGTIRCAIYVDGKLIERNKSTGLYSICTASR